MAWPNTSLISFKPSRSTVITANFDHRSLAGIVTPTLIINGARDIASRRRAGMHLQAALGAAEHVLIQDAGHLPNLDAPREYNQLMSGFARRHLPAAA